MYTAVRGGAVAIQHAEDLIEQEVHGAHDPIATRQVQAQLPLLLDQVMGEGSLYDPALGAVAVRQAAGDPMEAGFLLRAYRTTLPRLGYSVAASSRSMRVVRRISSAFRDIPGGQLLGLTRDYGQRLVDLRLLEDADAPGSHGAAQDDVLANGSSPADDSGADESPQFPLVIDFLRDEGMLAARPEQPSEDEPFDVTREPVRYPAPRSARLQILARGETGAMLGMSYAGMRGYGAGGHGTIAELRQGALPIEITHPVTGRPARIGWLPVTECHFVAGGEATLRSPRADYSMGYGVVTGRNERKAISMAQLDMGLKRGAGSGNLLDDQEFVLSHIEPVDAMGFVEHLKLPHYVTFQSSMQRSARLRALTNAARNQAHEAAGAHSH
ncbi:MAG: carbon-phosphorus lyase [Dehalococcoidia bacterium]|nr:carbon-phosphorus lyase [Dehalococcoidia bacterium]